MNFRSPLGFSLFVFVPALHFLVAACGSDDPASKKLTTTASSSESSSDVGSGGMGGASGVGGLGGAGGFGGAGGSGGMAAASVVSAGTGGSGGTLAAGGMGGTSDASGAGGMAGAGGSGGEPPLPPGVTPVWADYSKDSAAVEEATAVAADSEGNTIFAGTFGGLITIDNVPLGPAAKSDIYLAKLDKAGKHVWSQQFSSLGTPVVASIAVDAADGLVVAGRYDESLKIGALAELKAPAKGSKTVFVAKLNKDGNGIWSKSIGDTSDQYATDVVVDAAGDIVVTGYYKGKMDFGMVGGAGAAVTIQSSDASFDVFLAKLDKDGNPVFAKSFGTTLDQYSWSVTTDAAKGIAIAGSYFGSIDFGGGAFNTNDGNAFSAKFDKDGNHVWSKNMGGASFQESRAIAFDAQGDAFVTGYFSASMLLDQVITSEGDEDIFVAKIAGTDGKFLWSASFGDATKQRAYDLVVTSKGEPIVSGYVNGVVKFGSMTVTSKGKSDVAVAKLDAKGVPLWAGGWGGAGTDEAVVMARNATDEVLIGGSFDASIDFGFGNWTTVTKDLFVAKLFGTP